MSTVDLVEECKVVEFPASDSAPQEVQAFEVASDLFYEAKKRGGSGPDIIQQASGRLESEPLIIKTSDAIGWGRLCIESDISQKEATLFALRMVLKVKTKKDGFHKPKLQIGFRSSGDRKHVILHKESRSLRCPLNVWCEVSGVFSALKFEGQEKVVVLLPLMPDCEIEIDRCEITSRAARLIDIEIDSRSEIDVLESFSIDKIDSPRGEPEYDKVKIYSQSQAYRSGSITGHVYANYPVSHVDFSSDSDSQTQRVALSHYTPIYKGYAIKSGYQIDIDSYAADSIVANIYAVSTGQPQMTFRLHEGEMQDLLASLIDVDYVIKQLSGSEFARISNTDRRQLVIDKLRDSGISNLWPNPLFDPELMRANSGFGEEASVYDLLNAYVESPDLWEMETSSLFTPTRLKKTNLEPALVSYLNDPALWKLSPHELFSPDYFFQSTSRLDLIDEAPLAQYLKLSPKLKINPHPMFSTYFYATQFEEVWEGRASALDHFVRTGLGEPIPGFNQFLKEKSVSPEDRGLDGWSLLVRYEKELKVFVSAEPGKNNSNGNNPLIIQMTPKNARNPYYRQLPYIFSDAEIDYRFSSVIDDMLKWSGKSSRKMTLWFHQLEPFYHSSDRRSTAESMEQLLEKFKQLKKNGVKIVHTWHNAFPHDPRYIELDSRLYCEMDAFLDLVIVHSRVAVSWVRQFCNTTPVEVLPHPAIGHQVPRTTNKSLARKILKIPEDKMVYIHFGEIKPYKNVGTLIDAWNRYNSGDENSESLLLIEGKWSKDVPKSILRNAKSLIVNDVEIDNDRLGLILAAADVCVVTHKNIWISGVAMTALQFEMPLIVPDNSGLTEIIFEPENGFIFNNGDPDSLASCFRRVQQFDDFKSIHYNNKALNSQLQPKVIRDKYMHAFKPLLGDKQ